MDTPIKKSPSILDLASGMVAEELSVLRKYLDQDSTIQVAPTSVPNPPKKRASSPAAKKKLRHAVV